MRILGAYPAVTTDRPKETYAAVILYYRRGPRAAEVVAGVNAQTQRAASVVVVDNASGDAVVTEMIAKQWRDQEPQTLILDRNRGYAGGMNAGATIASATRPDWLLFLTHEVILPPDAVANLIRVGTASRAVAVGPGLRLPSGSTWSFGGTITRSGNTKHKLASAPGEQVADWLDGCCLLIRRDAFEHVGGFDETYFLYWEDVDISKRLAELGPVLCTAEVTVEQDTATTPIYYATRNRIKFWRDRSAWWMVLIAIFEAVARMALQDLVSARRRDRLAARLFGVIDGLCANEARLLMTRPSE